MLKNFRGITLIALVVTIIVLLILAGISISMLTGQNGILNRAQEAKEKTEVAGEEELRKLTQMEAAMNLENTTYTDNSTGKEITVTIPAGFAASQVEGENTIENGLVVIDKNGNEFVWVPVSDINRMVMCKSKTASEEDQCNIMLNENRTKLICTKHNNSENICGKLYAISGLGESFDSTLKMQAFKPNSELREPDQVAEYDESYNDGAVTEQLLENEFKEMALSVARYGGFYVGRYEMGLTIDNKPVSKNASTSEEITTADASNLATYSWYGLYNKAKEYNTNINVSQEIKSSMMWGCQYDAMMLWMQENGIDVKSDSQPTPTAAINKDAETGQEPNDILKNIFDIWGCHREWTLETYYMNSRISRGGDYNSNISPSYRSRYAPTSRFDFCSARLTLYM